MILALWNRSGEPVEEALLRSMLDSTRPAEEDGEKFWLQGDVGLAGRNIWMTPEERGQLQPLRGPSSGCVVACTARLDNRPELIHSLGLAGTPAASLSDAALILAAYQRWGSTCPAFLLGDFAFVIWDERQHLMFAARDAVGGQELVYFLSQEYLMMASRISLLLRHPALQPRLNEKKIAEFLAWRWGEDVDSYYESVFHLPPAHCLLVRPESFRLWQYWQVDPEKKVRYAHPEEYGEHYRELIKEALRCRLRSMTPVGISLSGGLDSASLTCLASEVLAEGGSRTDSLGSYSYVFDKFPSCDERAYILPVTEQAGRNFPILPRMVPGDALYPALYNQDWLISRDYPFQDFTYYLQKAVLQAARQDGRRVMLNGFAGDDLYAGEEFWFADLILSGSFRQTAQILLRSSHFITLKNDVFEHGLRAMLPEGLKRLYRAIHPRIPEWEKWLSPQLAARADLKKMDDPPSQLPNSYLPGQKKRFLNLFFSGYPECVVWLQDIAGSCGMEYRFPYMDRRIYEFVLGLPAGQVASPGVSRRILREALGDRLPEVVRQRQDKTAFFEILEKGFDSEKNLDFMVKSQIVERGFIRKDWLVEEINKKKAEQSKGVLWTVLSLERWLQRYWSTSAG